MTAQPPCCHCHRQKGGADGIEKIVLAGNPNVGKSVVFSYLTGLYREVSNYPGTTVEIASGEWNGRRISDTPGIYGVSSFNDEEIVARDIILDADIIVNIVDATRLERDLFLTLQLIDMGKRLVVALNFHDEAQKCGLAIDTAHLTRLLGVDVIPTTAVTGEGLDKLAACLPKARQGRHNEELSDRLTDRVPAAATQAEALLILEGDVHVARRYDSKPGQHREELYRLRRAEVNDIVTETVREIKQTGTVADMLGRAAINPLTGIPLLILTLYAIYRIIGVLVAGDIVGHTEEIIMQGYYEPWIRAVIGEVVPASSAAGQILIGEFGLLTMTVTYLLGLLLPLVVGFFLVLSLLEDTGYLPRIATLVDRLMTPAGLNGRAVIPLILGLGCVQLGTITTRLLESTREKSIATALLNLAIPCSAQIGVITGMLASLGGKMVFLYASIIFACLAAAGTLLNWLLPGKSSALLIDLPKMRLPRPANIFKKTAVRSWFFMGEASPWFFLGSFIVALLQVSGGLDLWQQLLAPLTEGWLQLPKETATAFVMGLVRRDFGAAGLTALDMTPLQTVTSLVVITLFVPCIASLMILFKERGPREAVLVWCGSWALAFLVGGLFSQAVM